jgi:hypothetical protein
MVNGVRPRFARGALDTRTADEALAAAARLEWNETPDGPSRFCPWAWLVLHLPAGCTGEAHTQALGL